jgi:hypothetical protein
MMIVTRLIYRSFRPLPASTRMTIRWLSIAGRLQGDPARQRPSIQDFCQRVVCKRGLNQRRAEVQPVALVIEHKAAQATAARSGLMINGNCPGCCEAGARGLSCGG